MRNWALAVLGAAMILAGGLLAWVVQTASGQVEVTDVRFPAPGGVTMSGLLYRPKAATPAHPAPAVLVSHGLINTREMQSPFAIELSRRGYVVLAMDMSGHGYSEGVLGQNGHGGPAAFAYLSRLPFVDRNAIGLEGHSLGGAPVQAAARANPGGYRAIVLEGSSTSIGGRPPPAAPGAPPPAPLRNVAVVFGKYDEFPTMWGVKRGSETPGSPRLMAFFGSPVPVTPGRIYGSVSDGTARVLHVPAINHPQEHFTRAGVGAALDWFALTMPAPHPRPSIDQVWLWKEIGTLVGFLGCVLLMLGVFAGVVRLPAFAALRRPVEAPAERRGGAWWLALAITAAVPAITYYPAMEWGMRIFLAPFAWVGARDFALHAFPQQVTNQLVVWALVNGLISFVVGLVLARGGGAANRRWDLGLLAAICAVGAGYVALALVDAVFKVDFRFWVLGLKPLDARHFGLFLAYLPGFTVFFLLAARSYGRSLPVRGEGVVAAIAIAAAAMSAGFIVMLAIQYGAMLSTGLLAHNNALLTIVAYQFVPLLMFIGAAFALSWRWTGGYAAGAFICALFITWYVVAGTAIYPPTYRPPAPAAAAR